jgi:hypothetical protein
VHKAEAEMEVAAGSADARQIPHYGGHGDLGPLDQLIRATPGAPDYLDRRLNLKDLRTSPGTAGCGCRGRSPGRLATGAGGQRVGQCSRGGDSSRACPAARARERLPRVPSAPVAAWALAGRFPRALP